MWLRRVTLLLIAAAVTACAEGTDVVGPLPTPDFSIVVSPEIQLSTDPGMDAEPDIEGDLVVWMRQQDHQASIIAHDVIAGTERVINGPAYAGHPKLSGNRIVWREVYYPSGNPTNRIHVRDVETGQDVFLWELPV